MTGLVEWLRSQLDTDEWWAREASRNREHYTEGGEHWRWECEATDTPAVVDPMLGEFVEGVDYAPVGLRSIEKYPTASVGPISNLHIHGQQELAPAVAGHIARNDPAHVLRTVAAHRAILDRHSPRKVLNFDGVRAIGVECSACFEPGGRCDSWEQHTPMDFPCPDVRALASIYESRPGFDPSWRAE